MQALKLTQEVTVHGEDMSGHKAQIKFTPYNRPGWYLKCGNETKPINHEIATYEKIKKRFSQITLSYNGKKVFFWEHVSAIRMTGLTGVVVESSEFPPYDGSPLRIWQELKEHCEPIEGKKIPWIKIDSERISSSNGNSGAGYVFFTPHDDPSLTVKIKINYSDIGRLEESYTLPMALPELEKIFKPCSLAYPIDFGYYFYYFLCRVYKNIFPVYNATIWPHEYKSKAQKLKLLEMIAFHRFVDILGGWFLLNHEGFPAGTITSILGGHKEDMVLLDEAGKLPFALVNVDKSSAQE